MSCFPLFLDQDQNLDRLSQSLRRQREVGLTINEELDSQIDMLDDTEHLVDRTTHHLGLARKQLTKIANRTKGCPGCGEYALGVPPFRIEKK